MFPGLLQHLRHLLALRHRGEGLPDKPHPLTFLLLAWALGAGVPAGETYSMVFVLVVLFLWPGRTPAQRWRTVTGMALAWCFFITASVVCRVALPDSPALEMAIAAWLFVVTVPFLGRTFFSSDRLP